MQKTKRWKRTLIPFFSERQNRGVEILLLRLLHSISTGLVYCGTRRMALRSTSLKKINLSFRSMVDLAAFKSECANKEFSTGRNSLTLVGSFSKEQLKVATGKYFAMYYTE